jgi:hypothetical protein
MNWRKEVKKIAGWVKAERVLFRLYSEYKKSNQEVSSSKYL